MRLEGTAAEGTLSRFRRLATVATTIAAVAVLGGLGCGGGGGASGPGASTPTPTPEPTPLSKSLTLVGIPSQRIAGPVQVTAPAAGYVVTDDFFRNNGITDVPLYAVCTDAPVGGPSGLRLRRWT